MKSNKQPTENEPKGHADRENLNVIYVCGLKQKENEPIKCQYLVSIVDRIVNSVEEIPPQIIVKAIIIHSDEADASAVDISWLRRAYSTAFISVYDVSAIDNPSFRLKCFGSGANMVAYDTTSIFQTLSQAVLFTSPDFTNSSITNTTTTYSCPYCDMGNLTELQLYFHCPAYHINWPNSVKIGKDCPICRHNPHPMPMQVHIHDHHGPASHIHTHGVNHLYNFSLVICKHPLTGKYLLCQEFADQGYWCPGGAVDPGESLTGAAVRETIEEAGVHVTLKGILGIEYAPMGQASSKSKNYIVKMRVIFFAEPSTDIGMFQLPKSSPDYESAGACWCTHQQIESEIKLRGGEPKQWARYLENGGVIYPLGILIEK